MNRFEESSHGSGCGCGGGGGGGGGCGHGGGPQGRHGHGMRGGPRGGFGPGFGEHGFGPGSGPRFGRGPKAGRGDVKLAILTLLTEEPRHGYQIIQELASRSNGMWQPSPGSVYPTLQALEDEGLVTAAVVEGKKVYSITETGRGFVTANARLTPPWEEIAGDPKSAFFDLRREIAQLGAAVMQVGQAGSEDQLRRALKLLSETRKNVYRILAEDEGGSAS